MENLAGFSVELGYRGILCPENRRRVGLGGRDATRLAPQMRASFCSILRAVQLFLTNTMVQI